MYKIIPLIITALFSCNICAVAQQTLIASSGGVFSTNNLSLSWSLGEIATETYTSNNLMLTQGVQQPAKKITGIYENGNETLELTIYPNPVKEMLFINSGEPFLGNYEIRVTDAQGKLVDTKKIDALPAQVETGQIEPGLYLFNLMKNNKIIYTSYIIKN